MNTVRHVVRFTGEKRVRAVFGGMHLVSADEDRIRRTIEDMRGLGVESVGPAHCTGAPGERAFTEAYGDRFFACPAGTVLEF